MDHPIAFPIALDRELAEKRALEVMLATMLERIALVTGVDLETDPTGKSVTAGLAVLDSLTRPTTISVGWRWLAVGSHMGGNGFTNRTVAEFAAAEYRLTDGFFVQLVRDGRALAPMYVAPTSKGAN